MRKTASLDGDYFDGLYRADPDPWGFTTRPYEAAKYDDTLAALGDERAARGLEVGCSIGVLTRRLAARCDRLVATDVSPLALREARRRCADLPSVEFRQVRRPVESFRGIFDLIVLSEVVYYWDDTDLKRVANAMAAAIAARGRVLLVHWLGETDYPKSADDAVEALRAHLAGVIDIERQDRREAYRLDLWRRAART